MAASGSQPVTPAQVSQQAVSKEPDYASLVDHMFQYLQRIDDELSSNPNPSRLDEKLETEAVFSNVKKCEAMEEKPSSKEKRKEFLNRNREESEKFSADFTEFLTEIDKTYVGKDIITGAVFNDAKTINDCSQLFQSFRDTISPNILKLLESEEAVFEKINQLNQDIEKNQRKFLSKKIALKDLTETNQRLEAEIKKLESIVDEKLNKNGDYNKLDDTTKKALKDILFNQDVSYLEKLETNYFVKDKIQRNIRKAMISGDKGLFNQSIADTAIELEKMSKCADLFKKFNRCLEQLDEAGFHHVINLLINFWSGPDAQKKANDMSTPSLSDSNVPALKGFSAIGMELRDIGIKNGDDYYRDFSDKLFLLLSAVFASRATGNVSIFSSTTSSKEQDTFTVGNFHWDAELPILLVLKRLGKVKDLLVSHFRHDANDPSKSFWQEAKRLFIDDMRFAQRRASIKGRSRELNRNKDTHGDERLSVDVTAREFSASRSHSNSIVREPSVSPARAQALTKDELALLNFFSIPAKQSADPGASLPVLDDQELEKFFTPRMQELYYFFIQEELAKLIKEEKERLMRSPLLPSSPSASQDNRDQKMADLSLPPAIGRTKSSGDPASLDPSSLPPMPSLNRSLSDPNKTSPTTGRRSSTVATVHFPHLDSPSGGGMFGASSHPVDQKPASNTPKEPANNAQAAANPSKKPGIT